MKSRDKRSERRKYPRIEKTLSVTLRGEGFSQVTETKNISGSGAYCEVSQPIPELSKLDVILLVPVMRGKKRDFSEIHCTGVVVRSEKILRENGVPKKYFIAIYFTQLRPIDRHTLCRYVSHQMTHKVP